MVLLKAFWGNSEGFFHKYNVKTLRQSEGYLLIDHSFSPGTELVGEGKKFEAPTMTCCHCGTVVIMNPFRTRDRHTCKKCMAYVCDNPACHVSCKPFSEVLDDLEKEITKKEQRNG